MVCRDEEQLPIRATYMRGGSSKAIFMHASDIPGPGVKRDQLLKRIMGSPDPLQVDGMGGTKAVTSKMAILSPSDRSDADVDYQFVQVAVAEDEVKYNINCGNISAAVGPFAIDEGLVKNFRIGQTPPVSSQHGHSLRKASTTTVAYQEVRIYNTGTDKIMISHVPVNARGKSVCKGDYKIAAVPGSGAPIMLDYRQTVGAALNRGLLPSRNVSDHLYMSDGRKIELTICDVGNICVFLQAADFGVTGHEPAAQLTGNAGLLSAIKEIRGRAAQLIGMCQDWVKVDEQSPFVPMPVLIAKPPACCSEAHVSGRLFLDNMCHESMAGTGAVCLAACSAVKGSVVNSLVDTKACHVGIFNIQHPLGIMPVAMNRKTPTDTKLPEFSTLSFVRTARKLMDGQVYVPRDAYA